jgi:hypothetical protein
MPLRSLFSLNLCKFINIFGPSLPFLGILIQEQVPPFLGILIQEQVPLFKGDLGGSKLKACFFKMFVHSSFLRGI